MDDQDRQLLASLLANQRVATLAIMVEGSPYASLVPFAMTEAFEAALIHTSRLAKHSEGLTSGAPFSVLIHQPDCQPETNPAQLARVTLKGWIEPLGEDTGDYTAARDLYLAKFPKSAMTFQLGDFTLYTLRVESCRFIAGFGKAFDVTPAELKDIE